MSVNVLQPVVLVVKAPNQQIADQTVECAWDWTIRKVKDHLATVYPSKPRQDQQKLIYYGRLLLDHLTLKDVLKNYDGQSTHTVHLVCSNPVTQTETSSNSESQSTVRRRNVPTSVSPPVTPVSQPPVPPHSSPVQFSPAAHQQHMAHFSSYLQSQQAQYSQAPHYMMNTNPQNPDHHIIYQRMYAHQYAQYLQYWRSMYQQHHPFPTPPPSPVSAPAEAMPAPQAPAAGPAGGRRDNQVVLNAGAGGAAMMDEEEDQDQDWLDWFYTACRFSVLLAIIYFYSTLPRALVGLMFFFFLYLYQQGWFNGPHQGRPRVILNEGEAEAPAPVAEPERAPEPEQNQPEQPPEPSSETTDTPEENVPAEPELAPVSRLYLIWVFFKTFFTSLLPRPQAVV